LWHLDGIKKSGGQKRAENKSQVYSAPFDSAIKSPEHRTGLEIG